jgi:hypothetical protein
VSDSPKSVISFKGADNMDSKHPIALAVSMGRRNTSPKSTCKCLESQKSFAGVISNGTLPCLVLIEYSRTDRFPSP